MQRIDVLAMGLQRCAILLAALVLPGCALLAPHPGPDIVSVPEPAKPQPDIVIVPAEPVAERPAPVKIPEPQRLPPVAIVLTNSQPAYADIADELARQFENYEIYDLSDSDLPPVAVLRLINDSESGTIVAIGLRAARSSVAMSDKPVVFSQVFNYQDYGLLNENTRGIAAIPPLDAQIAAWKKLDPTLARIGAIVGPGHDNMVAEAEVSAAEQGIELRVQITHSDQETLYFFKRMIRDIDGFWLFPDNRVLSRRALRQIMTEAQRQKVPVLVTSDSMLQIGASISVSSVASDIAHSIIKVIRQIQSGNLAQVPAISPLSEIRVKTNDTIQVVDR